MQNTNNLGNSNGFTKNIKMTLNEEFNFIKDRSEIINALIKSKEDQTLIALCVPTLGSGLFVTSVEEIFLGDDTIIQLKTVDITGFFIERNKIHVNEIVSACPLKSPWTNPLHREDKTTFKDYIL